MVVVTVHWLSSENSFSVGREQKYEDGIALLRNALANQSDCVLHRILGDFLVAVNEYQEAMDQYSIALRWVLSLPSGGRKGEEADTCFAHS